MGVIGIRARFRIWLAVRSGALVFFSMLLFPAIIAGVITAVGSVEKVGVMDSLAPVPRIRNLSIS